MRRAGDLLPGADHVVVCTPDAFGRLLGKRRRAAEWGDLTARGLAMPDFHLICGVEGRSLEGFAVAGADQGFRNGRLRPDPEAAFVVPGEPRTFHVLADPTGEDSAAVPEAPRAVLRRQVGRLAERGVAALAATELEFYVLAQSFSEARAAHYAGLRPLYHRHGDNDVLVTSLAGPFVRAVEAACAAAGIPVDQVQGEGGAGQLEINVEPAEPLRTADRTVAFKHLVKAVGHAQGRAVTFLPKPFAEDCGSGGHLHLSLAGPDGASALGEGATLSPLGRAFVAGIVAHAPAFALLHAPGVNSYRRLVPGAFTPLRTSWGWDNRTAMVRLLPGPRLEFRLPGADVNPYHSLAGLLAAGLAGVEAGLDLPPERKGAADHPDDPAIPADLSEAVALFAGSATARAALGEAVHAHILRHARHELAAARRAVTDWEVARGFEVA